MRNSTTGSRIVGVRAAGLLAALAAAALLLGGMPAAAGSETGAVSGSLAADPPVSDGAAIWQTASLDKACWGGMAGCEKKFYTSIPRLKHRIIFGEVSRGVERVEITCTGGSMAKDIESNWVIELPPNWRNCVLYGYGQRGSTFTYRLSD